MVYCTDCGEMHDQGHSESCVSNRDKSHTGRTTRSTAARMTKDTDVVGEAAMAEMSFTEKERRAQEEIDSLERELRLGRMEERLLNMRAEREAQIRRAHKIQHGGSESKKVPDRTEVHSQRLESSREETTSGYSDFGRSRRRSRDDPTSHRISRSDISASRRRRSKWCLKRYTLGGRDVRKLNVHELVAASTLWCLDLHELTMADYRTFIEHIHIISCHAQDNYYKDSTHIDYVLAVRKNAELSGFAAFAKRNDEESVLHYGAHNQRGKKTGTRETGTTRRSTGNPVSRACYAWNGEAGCSCTEEDCRYVHICSKWGAKSHKRFKCKE